MMRRRGDHRGDRHDGGGRAVRGLVREVPRLLLMAIGLLFLASLAMPLLDRVTGAEADPEQRLAARIEDLLPRVRDYDHIALPTTAPPAADARQR